MSIGPDFKLEPFQLEEWELISGEPVFYIPRDHNGFVCPLTNATLIEAYTYQHAPVDPERMLPCTIEEWDSTAFCLFQGKMCPADIALGKDGGVLVQGGVGYFSRNPLADLRWETQIEVKV